MKKINTPLTGKEILNLKAGDEVLLSGEIYTARDQAHKRLVEAIMEKRMLPIDLKGQVIYYCGPTTSRRMDAFTFFLLAKGLRGMIGKGDRSKDVRAAIKKYKAIYFLAPAGCGALISKMVTSAKQIAYKDLGPESIMKLKVKDFSLIVGIDSQGRSIYG